MRDDTHPVDGAPLGACVDQTHCVRIPCVGQTHCVRIQFHTASLPMGREFEEAELICTEDARFTMDEFAFTLVFAARQPERAGRPITLGDLLMAMVGALVENGLTADQITRAADAAEEEYYAEAGEERRRRKRRRRKRNRTEYKPSDV